MKRGIILFHCPDQKGIVGRLASLLWQARANIIDLKEHVEEDGHLFMRVEIDTSDLIDIETFQLKNNLTELADKLQATSRMIDSTITHRAAIFVTKENACLCEIVLKKESGELPIEIPLIISNQECLKPIADRHEIPFFHFPITTENKGEQEKAIIELLKREQISLIVLARYMQILSPSFVDAFPDQIINIHHSFLPAFKGKDPYRQAWQRGVKLIGATAHYVTAELDEGPIIVQDVKRVGHELSVEELRRLGSGIERVVLAEAIENHLNHRIIRNGKRTIVF